MFESRISAGGNESCLRLEEWTQISQRGLTTWKDTQKKKSMQRYCEVANKKTSSRWMKSPHLVYRPTPVQEGGRNWQRWENCQKLLSNRSQMQLFGAAYLNNLARAVAKWTSGRPDIIWSVNKLARAVTQWMRACDKHQARHISSVHKASNLRQPCHVGITVESCRLGFFQGF